MKKITAGSGYDYLIRQVAAQDITVGTGLAAYYEQKGEAPGEWIGSGLASLDGLDAGDPVTEAQMQALFGAGLHPLAEERRQAAVDAGLGPRQVEQATRLGKPFADRSGSPAFQQELRRRYSAANVEAGRRPSAKLDPDVRAQIRSEVAREFFIGEFGRPPRSPRELQGAVARWSRPAVATIAGFDLTFSPVKSVSSLWALADLETARIIEQAHRDAVAKALGFEAVEVLGAGGIERMLAKVFSFPRIEPKEPAYAWWIATSERIITVLEQERSTWQVWHVRAEAQRQTRAAGFSPILVERVVDTLVDLALQTRSIRLTPDDPIEDPDALRRLDGESVYTAAGAAKYTSRRILEAEQRIVAHAAQTD